MTTVWYWSVPASRSQNNIGTFRLESGISSPVPKVAWLSPHLDSWTLLSQQDGGETDPTYHLSLLSGPKTWQMGTFRSDPMEVGPEP